MLWSSSLEVIHNSINFFVTLALCVCVTIDFIDGAAWPFPTIASTGPASTRRKGPGGTVWWETRLLLAAAWRVGG
jgi:hypothetical protein